MRKPPALRLGDRVALVAPASPFARDEFDAGVAELRALGFEPVFSESVFARRGYVAGGPEIRARALIDAWNDPSVAAIVTVRGGYGSVQLLPLLAAERFDGRPKALVGYSDITSLLNFFTLERGIVSFHGVMVEGRLARGDAGFNRPSFYAALCRPVPMGELNAPGLQTIRLGDAAGPLVGGTLTQLVASLGTPHAFDPPPGFVLFFEDVGERPYRLDRMLTQLRLAGVLSRASAIVAGELRECDEPRGEPTAFATVADVLRDFDGPVIAGFPSGHTTGPSWTIPFGVRARVVAAGEARLVIEESAVE